MTDLNIQCRTCKCDYRVQVHHRDWVVYQASNLPIQKVFPYLSADERELIISETCGKCFELFTESK